MANSDNKAFDAMNESAGSDNKHLALAMAGMVPGPTGIAADITDAALYAKEKQWKDMGISLIGAIPILGQIASAKKIAKITKSIEATSRIRRIANFERMTESIENGSLLFANKKWQKAIDKGDMWMNSKSGDMFGKVGENMGKKIGNVYETPRYERYSDYYKMMGEVSDDMQKAVKALSPQELSFAKEMGKSPTFRKQMRNIILKLDKLLPVGD
jgi:hypothetical protein